MFSRGLIDKVAVYFEILKQHSKYLSESRVDVEQRAWYPIVDQYFNRFSLQDQSRKKKFLSRLHRRSNFDYFWEKNIPIFLSCMTDNLLWKERAQNCKRRSLKPGNEGSRLFEAMISSHEMI